MRCENCGAPLPTPWGRCEYCCTRPHSHFDDCPGGPITLTSHDIRTMTTKMYLRCSNCRKRTRTLNIGAWMFVDFLSDTEVHDRCFTILHDEFMAGKLYYDEELKNEN